MYSLDGESWTEVTVEPEEWGAPSYGNGRWTILSITNNSSRVLTSTDGTGWAAGNSGLSKSNLFHIGYDDTNSLFIATGTQGTVATSSDGSSWTVAQDSATSKWYGSVTKPRYVAAGNSEILLQDSTGATVIGTGYEQGQNTMTVDGGTWAQGDVVEYQPTAAKVTIVSVNTDDNTLLID